MSAHPFPQLASACPPLIERDAAQPYLNSIAMPLTVQVPRSGFIPRKDKHWAGTMAVYGLRGTRRGNAMFGQAVDAAVIGATGGFPGEVFQ